MTINKETVVYASFKGEKAQELNDWKDKVNYSWTEIIWEGYLLLKARQKAVDYVEKHI